MYECFYCRTYDCGGNCDERGHAAKIADSMRVDGQRELDQTKYDNELGIDIKHSLKFAGKVGRHAITSLIYRYPPGNITHGMFLLEMIREQQREIEHLNLAVKQLLEER